MIELTSDQVRALGQNGKQPPMLIDPTTQATYVLLRTEEYERLTREDYDDGPWTDEEMDLLAAEVDAMLNDDMAIEDDK
jgi:hypothetical protein